MSCSTHIYHKNDFGLTRRCDCHGAIHLVFGSISLLLTKKQFEDFTLHMADTIETESSVDDRDERCVYIPTRDQALMFVLTYNELLLLADILEQTLLMLQVEQALSAHP